MFKNIFSLKISIKCVTIIHHYIRRSEMNQQELLNLYLEKLRLIALEKMDENSNLSIIEALKEGLIYLEGEMRGY